MARQKSFGGGKNASKCKNCGQRNDPNNCPAWFGNYFICNRKALHLQYVDEEVEKWLMFKHSLQDTKEKKPIVFSCNRN